MLFVKNENKNPYYNLALEEWLCKNLQDECFMLWQNETAIFLGKNQNAYQEVNIPYAKEHNIHIVRRSTGGGAIFADEGNMMFTFISSEQGDDYQNYQKFTAPIVHVLNSIGIPAQFTGRNDLTIDGKKFSGSAQCRLGNKILHHGTLMYQSNTEALSKALNVNKLKLQSKGIASVKSRVTNISDYMDTPMRIEEFRQFLFTEVMAQHPQATLFELTEDQWTQVFEMAQQKHLSAEFIYGRTPQFNLQKDTKFPAGVVSAYLDIQQGRIAELTLYGDFFGEAEVSQLCLALCGVFYEHEALKKALQSINVDQYLKNINAEQLLTALI